MSFYGRYSREYEVYTLNTNPHVYFSIPDEIDTEKLTRYLNSSNHAKIIYLLNPSYNFNVFQYLDRSFIIKTKTGSYNFNIDLLQDTSNIIKGILDENPQNLQYQLNSKVNENVMAKIEQLYQGQIIKIISKEQTSFQKILEELSITSNFLRFSNNRNWDDSIPKKKRNTYQILPNYFYSYLKETYPKTFTIATKNKEYKCNKIGINSSKLLQELLFKNPSLNRYEYDFEDDCNEFQPICDFFNFNMVTITVDNMNSMKTIAEDLQIDFIINDVDSCIEDYEKRVKTLDDQQSMIDSIDEIFDILYNIKQITVEYAKQKIVESFWSQTEENVRELVAFICQVVDTDFLLHPYLADLIVSLDKEADDTNELKNLVPFIVSELMRNFAKTNTNSSFVYQLHKRCLISFERIKEEISKSYKNLTYCHQNSTNPYTLYNRNRLNSSNGLILFIPELSEHFNSDLSRIYSFFDPISIEFIHSYYPKNIENFKKMRDSGEPDDNITKALRYDDVDTFQAIVTKSQIDIQKAVVPFNLFEKFVPNGETNYINYAAAYGSVKCFKYLLLNHAPLNDSSFSFAVYGGNTEIVKIIDQKMSDPNTVKEKPKIKSAYGYPYSPYSYGKSYQNELNIEKFAPAIQKHHNKLFDWIIEQKYTSAIQNKSLVEKILLKASENGNSHSITTIIDKGFDFLLLGKDTIVALIRNASSRGFYRFLVFITNIMKKKIDQIQLSNQKQNFFNLNNSVVFGNLSIYKFSYEQMKTNENVNDSLLFAVQHNYQSIVEYIFDSILIENNECEIDNYKLLSSSITQESNDLFNYLIEKMIKMKPNPLVKENNKNIELLSEACYLGKFEISKKITDLMFELIKDIDIDLSLPFFNAAVAGSSELCQYFIDKKATINFNKILLHVKELASIKKDVLNIIVKNINPVTKEILVTCYIKEVISVKNKSFIEYLLKENAFYADILFDAIKTRDVEIIDMILNQRSDPSFINQISKDGTALNLAVKIGYIEIVKRLLFIPGIDPSLYEENNKTPLITAIESFDIMMMNVILDFYGPKIKTQSWQLDEAVKRFLNTISHEKDQKEKLTQVNKYESENEENEKRRYSNLWGPSYYRKKKNTSKRWGGKRELKSFADFLYNDSLYLPVFKRLLEIDGIDLNCHANNYTLFSFACEANLIDIVEMMIKNPKVDVNSYAQLNGNTPLMIAIEKQNIEIIKLLIECDRTDINKRNIFKKTALLMAVQNDLVDAVDLIVNNKKFDPFESCLNYAFYISKGKSSEKLITFKNVDVNYNVFLPRDDIEQNNRVNDFYYFKENQESKINSKLNFRLSSEIDLFSTPLINAVENSDLSKIDLIINHPEFDNEKSLVKEAILMACSNNNVDVFKKLIKLVDNNLNFIKEADNNLFDIAINTGSHLIVSEILNNSDFHLKEYNIVDIFASCFRSVENPSFLVMKTILSFDEEHEKIIDFQNKLSDGTSFFTCINRKCIEIRELIHFLIENGANPNLPDSNGCYPLEYAIINSWLEYTCALIETRNIDFTIKFRPKLNESFPSAIKDAEMTYLHLSVLYGSNDIFQTIIYDRLIDVNTTDSNGETPLMYACRCKNTSMISLLFEFHHLDYFMKNKDGDDALKIVLKMANVKKLKKNPRKKYEYCDHLIRFISNEWDSSEIIDKSDDENNEKTQGSIKLEKNDKANKKQLETDYITKYNPYSIKWLMNDDKTKPNINDDLVRDSNNELKTYDNSEESAISTNNELKSDEYTDKSNKTTNNELNADDKTEKSITPTFNKWSSKSPKTTKCNPYYNSWLKNTDKTKLKSNDDLIRDSNNELKTDDNSGESAISTNNELKSDEYTDKSNKTTNNELNTDDKTEKSNTPTFNQWSSATTKTPKYKALYNTLLTNDDKTKPKSQVNDEFESGSNSENTATSTNSELETDEIK